MEKDLRNLARVYSKLGKHSLAQECNREAGRVTSAMGESTTEVDRLMDEGRAHQHSHGWSDAEGCFRRALELSEKLGRKDLIAWNSNHLAHVLVQQGKRLEARPHAQRAVELYARFRSPKLHDAKATLLECGG